jgi:hypothetical protein
MSDNKKSDFMNWVYDHIEEDVCFIHRDTIRMGESYPLKITLCLEDFAQLYTEHLNLIDRLEYTESVVEKILKNLSSSSESILAEMVRDK